MDFPRFIACYENNSLSLEQIMAIINIYICIFIHGTDTLHCNQKNWNINSDLCVCFESIKIFHVTGILKKFFPNFSAFFRNKISKWTARNNHTIRNES